MAYLHYMEPVCKRLQAEQVVLPSIGGRFYTSAAGNINVTMLKFVRWNYHDLINHVHDYVMPLDVIDLDELSNKISCFLYQTTWQIRTEFIYIP
ncbi:hypothetical protein L798_13245 [Zootermopsis nevadensis]|uniref:Uncharacterized protein n=1 Tax=Zootermopsis nevadensis TaxID=136037 RepID=A0A067QSI0_ZOONE|nr:hypothetical protein L798_13245 [Zootermopsis nevadensis]